MAEPKKETVRIVLPPRRDGQTLASNPREIAMINLPPKPVQKSPDLAPAAPPAPASVSPPAGLTPPAPMIPKPPASVAPGLPKPPSASGTAPPAPPRPPSAIGLPPTLPPKPPGTGLPFASIPPTAPKPPTIGGAPAIGPASLPFEAKKETAKVPSSTGPKPGMPQATVQIKPKPPATVSKSGSPGSITVIPPTQVQPAGEVSVVVGAIALVASLAALGIQLWMMLG